MTAAWSKDAPAQGAGKRRMPVLFVGHGSPMNAIEDSSFSQAWVDAARRIPRPRAILCVSAHWETIGPQVTAMAHPRTIHDFSGFPDELNKMEYPAPGSPELAKAVQDALGAGVVQMDQDWGLDHGAWAVICRMYPKADIPVVQLSLDRKRAPKQHYELGGRLAPLREEGVLIVGSGNLVHNLPLMEWTDKGFPWAVDFDRLVKELVEARKHEALIDYDRISPDARKAIPTNEHYLPLLYALALQRPGEALRFFAEGIVLGSVSMRSVQIG